MAQAVQPIVVDVLQPMKGGLQVPSVTHSPIRASDILREGVSRRKQRSAVNVTVLPSAKVGVELAVHGLFQVVLALVLYVGVTCLLTQGAFEAQSHVEFNARIVVKASGDGLGNMAQAVQPIVVDVLLRSAGHGDMGTGGNYERQLS